LLLCRFTLRALNASLQWQILRKIAVFALGSYGFAMPALTSARLYHCAALLPPIRSVSDLEDINKQVIYLKSTADVRLSFPRLGAASLHLLVYTDASFGKRADKSLQGGCIVLLADKYKKLFFLGLLLRQDPQDCAFVHGRRDSRICRRFRLRIHDS
jgi:hypothetical protein